MEPTAVVFVPVSGPGGSGEYYRCLAIARALRGRHPDIAIHFLVHRDARLERDPAFHYHELNASPTRATPQVVERLRTLRPSLVVFDSAGRMAQFRAARRAGARLAWISDRPGKRRKAFRLKMLPLLDLHLTATPGVRDPRPGPLERLKCRLFPRLRLHFFSGIAPPSDPARRRELLAEQGLEEGDYLVFASGGGGYHHDGRPVPEIMLAAAEQVQARTGLACVVVMGPQYRGDRDHHETVHLVRHLPTGDLSQLLYGARVAVIGAGSMMTAQTLSIGVSAVMVPAGGKDQPPRIADFSRRGLATAARMEADDIGAAAMELANNPTRRQQQSVAVRKAGMRNDVERVAEVLIALLQTGTNDRQAP